jgi:hypothetical protein
MTDNPAYQDTLTADPIRAGVTADINKLFEGRARLTTRTVDHAPVRETTAPTQRLFAEEVTDGDRRFVDLTERAIMADEELQPTPARPKGKTKISDLPAFIAAVKDAVAAKFPVTVRVLNALNGDGENLTANAILNDTRADGSLGFGDWSIGLCADPEPMSSTWLKLLNKPLKFQEFADLVYACGDVVVDAANHSTEIKRLAGRLKLNVAADLSELLLVCNGLELGGTIEETVTEDANTGDMRVAMARAGKPNVSVPTGIVIGWTPFPDFSAPILLRLTRRTANNAVEFTLKPVNLMTTQGILAHEIHSHLLAHLDGTNAPVHIVNSAALSATS